MQLKIPKIKEQPMMLKARRLAKQLYNAYNVEEKENKHCGNLLLHWIQDCYWGLRVNDCLPVFDKVWQILHEKKHTKRNKFIYGDIDVGLWVEYSKTEHRKVIISESYCTCAEDNIHIFIRDKHKDYMDTSSMFRVATVWAREIKSKSNANWGDDRDIGIPSLNTYRKRDFQYGYFDGRDKGHSILYHDYSKRTEDTHWAEGNIEHALTILVEHLKALEQQYKLHKSKRR